MAELVGKRLGKYQIQAELGRGGMGTVYLALDPLLDRQVAIKVLAPHLVWEEGFVERFLREARAAARLRHPHIVTIHDVGQEGQAYYFVMEYLEGQSLTDRIRQQGPLPPQEVLSVLQPLASALDYAHHCGVVHRDIKPSNVTLDREGQVTLTDFGIAKAAQDTRLTSTGTIIGTPEYMSPEQARGEEVGPATDLYSLAIVAFEMLSGRTPFGGTTPHAVLHQQIYEPPPPIRSIRPELPPAVEKTLQQALAKEPAGRLPTATNFVEALAQALASQAQTAAPPLKTSPRTVGAAAPRVPPDRRPKLRAPAATPAPRESAAPGQRAPARRRLPTWLWSLGGLSALILAAGVIAAIVLGGGTSPEPTSLPLRAAQPTPSVLATLTLQPSPSAPPAASAKPQAAALACTDPLGCVRIGPGDPVLLGALLALSGGAAPLGNTTLQGIEMAIDDSRGIRGHPIELSVKDSQCTPAGGRSSASNLASEAQVLAAIGTTCSASAFEAAPVLCAAGIPLVSPSNTGTALTAPGRPPSLSCYLRTAWPDALQGAAAAQFAWDTGARRAATFLGEGTLTESAEVFQVEFERRGGQVALRAANPAEETGIRELLVHAGELGCDLIYAPVGIERAATIVRLAREIPALEGTRLLLADAAFSPELVAMAGKAAAKTLIMAPDLWALGRGYEELMAAYRARYGEPASGMLPALGYDATMLVLTAVQDVARQEPDGTLQVGRQALIERLYATRYLRGVTGTLSCNVHGDCGAPRFAVLEIRSADPERWEPGPTEEHNPRRVWP
jgi:serine/threonine protein kinase/ABC-type branched-subunit amino acid transport system substrate-binding protein